MIRCFTLLLFSFLFFAHLHAASPAPRSEFRRYTVLRDKIINERSLKKKTRDSYFDFELHLSSGTKSFFSDLSNAAKETDKTAKTLTILTENINTERLFDLDLNLQMPLPFLSIAEGKFLPSVIYENNISGLFSISNTSGVATSQLYAKWDNKFGVNTKTKWRGKNTGLVALYQLERKDLNVTKSAATIAENSGDLVDTDELNKSEKFVALDYQYQLSDDKRELTLRMEEIKLYRFSSSDKKSAYTRHPYLNLRYQAKSASENKFRLSPFIGHHTRFSYALVQGLYAGVNVERGFVPLSFMGMMDYGFLTLAPAFDTSWIKIQMTAKLPFLNPVDDLWVPAIYALAIQVPF
jgi:hypothetical protein